MSLDPEFLIGLAVLGAVAIYLFVSRPKPPSPTAFATAIAPLSGPPDHASDALAALERAERQAAARRLDAALGQHHLGQLATAMGLAIDPKPAIPPSPQPQPQPQPQAQPPAPAPKA